ncbi:MAG: hypothetical protein ACRD1D_17010 [Acidimicrobiales bacterium]
MRRLRVVLAAAALTAPMLVAAAGPAQALNTNSVCRQVTNDARRLLPKAPGANLNQAFNQDRNETCGSLPK